MLLLLLLLLLLLMVIMISAIGNVISILMAIHRFRNRISGNVIYCSGVDRAVGL